MADYYSVIARAVSRLPTKTDEARHAIYDRARTAVQESLRTHDPPRSPAELAMSGLRSKQPSPEWKPSCDAVQEKRQLCLPRAALFQG